nr:hypothetical protein [Tanacetum cinerariifolium]
MNENFISVLKNSSIMQAVHHGKLALPLPPPVIDNTRQPQMSDMTALLNDLSYIPPNNKHNEPTQGDIVCNISRWKDSKTLGKKVPKKVLRYFPIIPRLQCLYKSSHTAKEMIWHATGKCIEPGKMQHPVDGSAWKNFDTKYLDFAKEPKNVRLGLAVDGFNPFGNLKSSFMLTLLIPGPKSPGKDIDVYLRPLIEDLKVLWDRTSVETIDVALGQKFNMRAMILWTINDFPAQSSLSGWSGQGYKACPTCNKDTPSVFIQFDAQELKKVKWYVLHNSPEIDTYRSQFQSLFPNKDMKEEFPDCHDERHITQNSGIWSPGPDGEMYYGQLQEILEFKYLLFKVVLFRVKWFDTRNQRQDDPDIIHFDNSSDLPLSTSLNDLDNATLHIDGQSIKVDVPPDIIDVVDKDDDITDDEDALLYDLADFDNEDLINIDDDGVDKMFPGSTMVMVEVRIAPSIPCTQRLHGCFANRGKGKRKPNLGGRVAGWLNTCDKTRNLSLKEIKNTKGPVPIQFELRDKQTIMPLGDHAAHWSSYIGEVITGVTLYYPSWLKVPKERKAALITNIGRQTSTTQEYPSLIDTFFVAHTVNGEFLQDEDRPRGGKQRGHILGVGRVLPARAKASPSTPVHESTLNCLHKKVDFMMNLFKSDSKYLDMFSQFESGGASGSGGCGDEEDGADHQDDEDEDADGDT